jgi:hypothetical protein
MTDIEIERIAAETRKFVEESQKLAAERDKLFQETLKLERERLWYVPALLIGNGALAAVIGAVVARLLH